MYMYANLYNVWCIYPENASAESIDLMSQVRTRLLISMLNINCENRVCISPVISFSGAEIWKSLCFPLFVSCQNKVQTLQRALEGKVERFFRRWTAIKVIYYPGMSLLSLIFVEAAWLGPRGGIVIDFGLASCGFQALEDTIDIPSILIARKHAELEVCGRQVISRSSLAIVSLIWNDDE